MKCFAAVLFFVLLTERSFATECCSNNTLDIASLEKSFQLDIDNIVVPPVECGDRWSGEFKNSIGQAIKVWIFALLGDRLTKARHLGDDLIKNIQKACDRIKHAIGLTSESHSKRISMEKAVLPDTPVLPLKLKSKPTELSAKDIFLNGVSTQYDRNLQMFGWMTHIFQTILDVRITHTGVLELIREQINDEVLNCSVMGAYKRIVIKVLKHAGFIRVHVSPDTWEYFQDAADRILDISKAYCEALKLVKP